MNKLMSKDIPTQYPGLVAYDSYWKELSMDAGYRTVPDIREVINISNVLSERVSRSFTRPAYQDMALRIIDALSLHRLTVNDIHAPVGATAKELRDTLCLYQPGIEDLGGDPADDLLSQVETVLREIHKTVSGQFISHNTDNHQFYIDLKKTDDFDAIIEQRAETLSSEALNRAYHKALYNILECSDLPDTEYRNLWGNEITWVERNSGRMGWLFFGTPNERSTVYPPRDFYLYFIQPFEAPKIKDAKLGDELQFFLSNFDDVFKAALERYAAAIDLSGAASGHAKATYEAKANNFQRDMNKWLQENMNEAFNVVYQGKKKPMMDWVKGHNLRDRAGLGPNDKINFRDMINTISGICLSPHFEEIAPDYPQFSVLVTNRNREQYAKDAIRVIGGGNPTKQATAVLDALKLLDGSRITPAESVYARFILDKLKAKAKGQVVNHAELLEEFHGIEYLSPNKYHLETEWVAVILSALVYSGDIVLAIPGTKFDASKLSELSATSVDDIAAFKHIEQPKDWNLPGLQALFELLDLAPGLAVEISQNKDGSIAVLQSSIEERVNKLVTTLHSLREQLPFWSGNVLTDAEAEQYKKELTTTKDFLESLQAYNSAGKLKNFRFSADEVREHKAGLDQLKTIDQLQQLVEELTSLANYLSKAEAILPIEHKEVTVWQERLKATRLDLLQALSNKEKRSKSSFRSQSVNQLTELKNEYIRIYSSLYAYARLTISEDKQKAKLLNDSRIEQLQSLSTIDTLPSNQLNEFRNKLASLKAAGSLSEKDLLADPVPINSDFRPNQEDLSISASQKLEQSQNKLDYLVEDWTQTLLNDLEDPITHDSLNLLEVDERKLVDEFIKNKALPDSIEQSFVKALRLVLQGLVPVEVTPQQVNSALFGQGSAVTIEQLKSRLDAFLKEQCKGQDVSKIRIVLK